MAQHSHVPKFGNWDSENVPYTIYFENARKDKDSGGKIMNPNDPEENPDLFRQGHMGGIHMGHVNDAPSVEISFDRMIRHSREEGNLRHNSSLPKTVLDQHYGNRRSITSDSSTERSSSDRSLIHPNLHHRTSSRHKTSMGEGSYSSSHGSSERATNHRANDIQSHRVASVPKFGAWDETDPKSGEGFTVIFNKVKEEKHIAATTLPTTVHQQNVHSSQKKWAGSASKPKKSYCCCLLQWFNK